MIIIIVDMPWRGKKKDIHYYDKQSEGIIILYWQSSDCIFIAIVVPRVVLMIKNFMACGQCNKFEETHREWAVKEKTLYNEKKRSKNKMEM